MNVSSSAGRLSMIDGAEPAASALRDQFSSPQLTVPQLEKLMHNFIDLGSQFYSLGFGRGSQRDVVYLG